ncbi:epoxide hydrolase family protein [Nonomuraea endophytica]|uniref:Pimeloyl-ACP methyl ester carboxylesterase n=1 Tax=Nonomuraea endophytica TaxID=714136 RepID=A0A7W8AFK5_9ACTN|nr:epoxide hydrolase family protein [Nonomuraea endophytica]MBB5085260.1 pimeloyl-ACP methyl ester carboxylesterase [Nonomuraea endophytica]
MTIEAFDISLGDDVLLDLRERLSRTLYTQPSDSAYWAAGVDPGYLRELVAYWAGEFDWRAAEARLNAFPQFLAEVNGRKVHFVHLRAERPEGALPLVLTHGWPSSFVEMLRVAPLLTGRFDVVIPSLPGFLFSDLPGQPYTRRGVAEIWHELMTGVLGYERFGAFGGDIGGGVTQWLGALFPESVAGVHVTSAVSTADFSERPATPEEQAYLDHLAAYDERDQGYSEIMWTRPDTIAAALADSPAGLIAWIIDKYRDWSDCDGDLEKRWDKDTLCTVATLYWATGSIGSSFRQYYDYPNNRPVPPISVPAAITLSNEPAYVGLPRSLPERVFSDLRHWSNPGRGGHFMSHEEPEQVAREITDFFGPLS